MTKLNHQAATLAIYELIMNGPHVFVVFELIFNLPIAKLNLYLITYGLRKQSLSSKL